jgi:hypothetical protein
MPITLSPLIEGALLDAYSYGYITVSDFHEMLRQAHAAADATSNVWIHLLFDARAIAQIPTVSGIMGVMRDTVVMHPRIGWILIVRHADANIHFAVDVVFQLTRQRVRTFSSIHEAIEFLKTMDSTVDWSHLPEDYAARDAATP